MYHKDDRPRPTRIRLTGLQEAQLPALVALDAACAAMFYALGFDAAEVPVRSEAELVALTNDHNVHVVEADQVPAGFLAWRDESPGIAYLADIAVHPDYQRFGIGSKLLQALRDEARTLRLPYVIVRAWERAPWAMAFYRLHGFGPIGAGAPARVLGWRAERLTSGTPLTRPGEIVLWTDVGAAPVIAFDEEQTDPGDS
jgi:amino-acid N-acetyltransferase